MRLVPNRHCVGCSSTNAEDEGSTYCQAHQDVHRRKEVSILFYCRTFQYELHKFSEPGTESEDDKPQPSTQSSQDESGPSQARYDVDAVEAIPMLQAGSGSSNSNNQNINPLEALLGGGSGFPPILDIPSDADDETMVELAIALSLQEHELGGESSQQAMHGLQVCVCDS